MLNAVRQRAFDRHRSEKPLPLSTVHFRHQRRVAKCYQGIVAEIRW